jgi:hypothetical protein
MSFRYRLFPPVVCLFAAVVFASTAVAQPIPPEFQVNSIITSTQGSPAIAMATDGFFATTFTSAHVPGTAIMSRLFDPPTTPVAGDMMVSATGGTRSPAIAIGSSHYVVAWERSTGDTVKVHVFDHTGTPADTMYTIPGAAAPAVAMHSSGSFVVIYERPDSSGAAVTNVFGQRFGATGGPVGLEFPVNIYTDDYQRLPSVAMDDSGNFIVVWQSNNQDGSWFGVFARRFDSAANPLTGDVQINTYNTFDQDRPDVAMRGTGEYAVVWESSQQDGSSDGVYCRLFDAAGDTIRGEFRVNQFTVDMQNDAACTFDGLGNLIVTWTSEAQDGDVSGVFCRRFGLLGQSLGNEFQVNVQTILYQFSSDVAADDEGNFVVVWQSFFGDGDLQGCFGRHYDAGTLTSATPRVSAALTLSQNTPNPFNPTTTIEYMLPEAGPVELAVYDARGRRVATLVSGTQPLGLNHAAWNGRDAAGVEVSSGVYFYRLRANGRTLTRKMVLVK